MKIFFLTSAIHNIILNYSLGVIQLLFAILITRK